ncbi:hypothetical protein L6452_16775 [Arctium lappa]|uniref:Uncharacterized protein n=1 Tax=Arctium lappa TaxID=4217 RepID=A0ACB9C1Q8_ARCLA|nr:hypothetical protein L6452_16775 [Arctium lappa]
MISSVSREEIGGSLFSTGFLALIVRYFLSFLMATASINRSMPTLSRMVNKYVSYGSLSKSTVCLRGWSSLLALAIPTRVSVYLEWWWDELMIMLCRLLSNPRATVASMGILIQTTSLVYVFPSALSLGVSTRVGNELGANRTTDARVSMIVSFICATEMGLMAMVFTTLMRHRWGRFFTTNVEIIELTDGVRRENGVHRTLGEVACSSGNAIFKISTTSSFFIFNQ